MKRCTLLFGIVIALSTGAAYAQQIYRWVDAHGETHVSDRPPPPGAQDVSKKNYGAGGSSGGETPYALARAMKDAPVTLYTSPICKAPCAEARAALNKRGVPFKEVVVWNPATNAELKSVSGSNEVPVLVVGASVHKGYSQSGFDDALDVAGYPKAGLLPARSQGAPALPKGYVSPSKRAQPPAAAAPQPEEEAPQKLGPYAPR